MDLEQAQKEKRQIVEGLLQSEFGTSDYTYYKGRLDEINGKIGVFEKENKIVFIPDWKEFKKVAEQAEFDYIEKTLIYYKYNRAQAANALGIDRKTLYNKLRKYK